MSDCEIITNNQERESVYFDQCTPAQKRQIESAYGGLINIEESEFVFYRGYPYFMGDCMRTRQFGEKWDGYFSESFFSGVVVKMTEDGYIFGTFYAK
jgi:hypothetical protein